MDPIASQDPEYLAFMRGAGYSEAEVMADLARRQGSLTRQLDRAAPRFKDELRQAEGAVDNDFQGRGLYRGGARMVKRVDAGNVVRRNEADFRAGIADQREDLNSNAMKQIAEQRRIAMDMALTSRQTAAINAANASGGPLPTTGVASDPYSEKNWNDLPAYIDAINRSKRAAEDRRKYPAFRDRTVAGRPGVAGRGYGVAQ